MTKAKRAWAVRLDEFEVGAIYRVYPTMSRKAVRSFARDQVHRKAKVVLVEIREIRRTQEKRASE